MEGLPSLEEMLFNPRLWEVYVVDAEAPGLHTANDPGKIENTIVLLEASNHVSGRLLTYRLQEC